METDCEDDILPLVFLIVFVGAYHQYRVTQLEGRRWMRPWISRRGHYGAYHSLIQELASQDRKGLKIFLRMDLESFNTILEIIKPQITHQDTHMRHIGKGSMDIVNTNDGKILDEWHMHYAAKRSKIKLVEESTINLCCTSQGESEESNDKSFEIIRSLLMQGTAIDAQTDRTGETALHLTARYGRADAAKALLDAGANLNTQDTGGRTPLHTAVASDTQDVFQLLLRHPSTNLNARTHDGTTPMILAARLAIEGMIEELIIAKADINAMDGYGKTPLHWAAAVNNTEATLVLLQYGAEKDAQDLKDEVPLFLAAKEGSYESAKILLDHFANSEITDEMGRLPRDIAAERMHHDILNLLDTNGFVTTLQNYNTAKGTSNIHASQKTRLKSQQLHPMWGSSQSTSSIHTPPPIHHPITKQYFKHTPKSLSFKWENISCYIN